MPKFLRRITKRYSKLGKGRKKKQVWRRPKGRDNKMREKRKGYPARVSVGYRTAKKTKGLIEESVPVIVRNIRDLEKLGEKQIIILGNVGKKKKIEILKKAEEKKMKVYKINSNKFIKKNSKSKKIEENKK
jgi:large subunit ribosomal protein L32e